MYLTSPDEVFRYVGATLLEALAQPAVAARLAEHPVRLRFGVIDPDCVLYIDTERRDVRFLAATDAPVTGMVAMNADTALRYCQGGVDLDAAVAAGEIAADGDSRVLLEILNDDSGLPRLHAKVLRRAGRSDLLARNRTPQLAFAG
jgi:hypothetical protein